MDTEQAAETKETKIKPYDSSSLARFLTFKETNRYGYVHLTNEVSYSQYEIIRDNIMDKNFTFAVPYFSDGSEKIFFSLPYILADATYRNTDVDTKDVQVKSDNPGSLDWIPLIRGALRNYLKVNGFEEIMNDIRRELIDMGHVLTKEVDGETKIVNLLNIIRPADIMDIQDGGIAEITYPTYEDMLKNRDEWKDSWDDIEELRMVMESMQRKTYKVYEWWTIDEFVVAGEKKRTRGCIKFLDKSIMTSAGFEATENWQPAVELERFASPYFEKITLKKKLKKLKSAGLIENDDQIRIFPYEEQRLVKVNGRWMGMGYYELLRQEGKAFNRTLNEKLQYDEVLHKGIVVHTKSPYTSSQKGSGRGLESDIMNRIQTGAVVSIKAGEKMDRLNLGSLTADFLMTAEHWFKLARQKVGVSETAIGDRLPSNTTATVGVLNEKQSKNAFDIVNEQQGIYFANLFTRFKIKEIIEDITEEEWTKITGDKDELTRMEESFIDNLVHNSVNAAAATGKIIPNSSVMPPEELQRIKDSVKLVRSKQGESRFAQFKKDIIENFDFNVSFVIGNDMFDRQATLNAVQSAIDTVSANPMSELDMNKLVELKLDLMDINPSGFRKSPEQIQRDREMAIAAAAGQNSIGSEQPIETPAKTFGQNNAMTI
jgi:hypothetical protein